MDEYENTFQRWHDSLQKFDYYVVGIVGAGLIVLIRDLKIATLGLNSPTVEGVAIVFLFFSFWAGLRRLEKAHMVRRFENELVRNSSYRNAIKTGGPETAFIKDSTFKRRTSEESAKLEANLDRRHTSINAKIERTIEKMAWYYSLRDGMLIAGLILLLISRFIDPLTNHLKPNQALAPTATYITPAAGAPVMPATVEAHP